MRFPGRLVRGRKYWLVEIPAFDAMTQGRSKSDALRMAEDLLESLADVKGFRAKALATGPDSFEIGANKTNVLLALLLRRQRERHGLTLAEAAQRLGQSSKNAYARYEQGRARPSVEKLEELLSAIAPDQIFVWHTAA